MMPLPRTDPDTVAILWNGLPHYAVTAIASAIRLGPRTVVVVSTIPSGASHPEMEQLLGGRIHWIGTDDTYSFRDLGETVPAITFTAGWSVPSFMRLAREARRAGGKVVCMCDNSFRGDLRQVAGAVVYRIRYSRLFDHVWVPGKSGSRLMRFFGVPASRISEGLYTADTTVFRCTTPIELRPLQFVFAGQFIDRKNVLRLCEAFLRFRRGTAGACALHLYGSGPLRDRIPSHPDIHVHPFATPPRLSAAFNQARCLVLPSTLDHWGLVVHEAACCGTLLIASRATGAAQDLCAPTNSHLIDASSIDDIVEAFHWVASLDVHDLAAASRQSQHLAAAFSIDRWGDTFRRICKQLTSAPAGSGDLCGESFGHQIDPNT
ncbi:MAG: glycosyltransferase [Planctomycetia bacterium]|nr:glycosyltransferase [Planctomycetia bacterium]